MNTKNTSKNLRRNFAGAVTLALAGGFSLLSIQSFAEESTTARLDAIQAEMAKTGQIAMDWEKVQRQEYGQDDYLRYALVLARSTGRI